MKEIERKFLLKTIPAKVDLKAYSKTFAQQVYLRRQDDNEHQLAERFTRKEVLRDSSYKKDVGKVKYSQNIKIGSGLVRDEYRSSVSEDMFYAVWNAKVNGIYLPRVQKNRFRVEQYTKGIPKVEAEVDSFIWEIDAFVDRDLYIAEVELPWEDCPYAFPDWLEPFVDKEVTDDPRFSGSRLAK